MQPPTTQHSGEPTADNSDHPAAQGARLPEE